MEENSAFDKLKETAYGHADIWECSEGDFISKVIPVIRDHSQRNNLSNKVIITASQFLRMKFDQKDLKGTIEYEVSHAIEEALMYYANVLGEEV